MTTRASLIETLRAKPRGWHAAILIVSAWLALGLYWFDHRVGATIAMLVGAGLFLKLHPVVVAWVPKKERARRGSAANDE